MKKENKRWVWMAVAFVAMLGLVAGIYFLSIPRLIKIDESKAVPRNGISFLDVEAYVSDVNVTVGGDEFKARLHGKALSDERYRARLVVALDEATPGLLLIYEQRNNFELRLGGGEALTLDITIPEGFNTNVALNSTSGKVYAEGIEAHMLSVVSISGDVEVRNCRNLSPESDFLGATSVKSGSGRVVAENVENDSVSVSSASGAVTAADCSAGNLLVESIAGQVDVIGAETGGLTVSTSSGAIFADVAELRAEATLDSMSGPVSLALPRGMGLQIDASSVSGEVNQNYPSAEAGMPVIVATISGNISIEGK